jgi:hypothetical protein
MAIYALQIKHRAKGKGASASAHALYIAREGKYAGKGAQSHAEYLAREGKHERRAHELEATWSGNLPEWAESPKQFWEAADIYERANGRVYTEIVVALPRELSRSERTELTRNFVEKEIGDRFPYTVAIHNPKALDGGAQPHAHIMFSIRERDGIERDKDQFFKRANEKNPEKGGAKKSREWSKDSRENDRVNQIRESWERLTNGALERAGYEVRIDRRTLEAQGIDREPEPKMGPAVTQKLKRGQETEIGQKVIELRSYRKKAKSLERLKGKLNAERGKLYEFPGRETQERNEFRTDGPKRKVSEEEKRRYQRTVDLVLTRYARQDGTVEFRWKKSGTVAFVDKGDSLEFKTGNQTAIKAGLQVAKEKGWEAVHVLGTEEFRRDAWLQAELMGLRVTGYDANQKDRRTLEEMRAEQEKQRGPSGRDPSAPQREPEEMQDDEKRQDRKASPSREETTWAKASDVLKSYEKGKAKVQEEIEKIDQERKELGLEKKGDWQHEYPRALTEKEAFHQARLDYDGRKLRTIWTQAMDDDEEYNRASKAYQQFEKKQQERNVIQRLSPANRREGKELYSAAGAARTDQNRSAQAYNQLLQEYEKPEHKTRIETDARTMLEADKSKQAQRAQVEQRLVEKRKEQDDYHKAIYPLKILGDREIQASKSKDGEYRVNDFQELLNRVKEIERQRKKSMEKGKGMER